MKLDTVSFKGNRILSYITGRSPLEGLRPPLSKTIRNLLRITDQRDLMGLYRSMQNIMCIIGLAFFICAKIHIGPNQNHIH